MTGTRPTGGFVVEKQRALIAYEISNHLGLKPWERQQLARFSHESLTALARACVPGWSENLTHK